MVAPGFGEAVGEVVTTVGNVRAAEVVLFVGKCVYSRSLDFGSLSALYMVDVAGL